MKKKYYKIVFKLDSPLAVGSGDNLVTDSDIVRNSKGMPYIPGSSLAGVYRSFFAEKEANEYFGYIKTGDASEHCESSLIVYDANILEEKDVSRYITKRDMVALNEYKVAVDTAKFDIQVLEPGVIFVTYIEQTINSSEEKWIIDDIAYLWENGFIKVGSKTTRGYGAVSSTEIYQKEFDFNCKEQRDVWFDFDIYGDADWGEPCGKLKKSNLTLADNRNNLSIKLSLKQEGGISVRRYSTKLGEADYEQLTIHENMEDEKPVIPGTAWAGAFLAQLKKLNPEFDQKEFFGYVSKNSKKTKDNKSDESKKSRLTFSESVLKGGKNVVYTRNAIDRFTGGTINGALFTDSSYYDGETDLCITVNLAGLSAEVINSFCMDLAAAIYDLHKGYMAIGGVTAVGRGLFTIKEIFVNGEKLSAWDEKKDYATIKEGVKPDGTN